MAVTGNVPGMVCLPASGTFDDAYDRLESAVAQRGLTVFARINFAADAAAAGLAMSPARMLLFGSPKAGTPLMVAAPTVALDLPLKVLVWQDAAGQTWVGYNDPDHIVQRHSVPPALAANLQGVRAIAASAADSGA